MSPKKSHDSISKQQFDALALQVKARHDPVYFGEKFLGMQFYPQQKLWLWITTKTQKKKAMKLLQELGICFSKPEFFAKDVDTIYSSVFKHIFCVANQAGKTTMTAVKHIWSCYFKIGKIAESEHLAVDDYKTLNISPHSDQSNKCFEYVCRICRGEMVWYDPKTKKTKQNITHPAIGDFISGVNNQEKEIRFINGSIFWSKSLAQGHGTSRAGEQFGLITFDEASQAYDLEATLTPLLSRILRYGYCFDIISTPEVQKPSHGFYLRLVKKGIKLEDGWFALTGVKLDDNVFIDPEQLKKTKKMIKEADPVRYQQVVYGKFVSHGRRLFSVHAVNNIFRKDLKQQTHAIPTRKYILSADWAMADTGDKTWFIVIDYTDYLQNKYNIVYHEVMEGGDPNLQYATCRDIYQRFGGAQQCKFIMDSSSMGGTIVKKQLYDLKPIDFIYQHGKKDEMIMMLSLAIVYQRDFEIDIKTGDVIEKNPNYGKLRSYEIEKLEEQLGNYRTDDKKLEQDGVMSLGQAVWWIEKLPKNIDVQLDINPMSRYNNNRFNKWNYRR